MANEGKEIIKKLDSDRVLEGILNKMSSMKQMASGTEANDVLSGISEITKTTLQPLKMVTSAMSDFKKNAIEWDEKNNKDKNKKDNNQDTQFPEDIAKDSTVIDLSKALEDLVEGNNRDLVDVQAIGIKSQQLLEDLQKTLGLMIYGQDAIENQLKSNQKNTKVFQVSKKELNAFEKEQLKLQENQTGKLSVLDQIRDDIIQLDEQLTNNLVEALTQEESGTHESNEEQKPDAQFPNIEKDNKKKDADEKTFKDKSLEKLQKVWDSIKLIGKYSWHLIKLATVTAAVAAAQLAIIGAVVIGIDLLQAWLSTKFNSWSELGDYIGNKVEEALQWVARNFILEPLDRLGLILDLIDIGITSLERSLILKLADVVEAMPWAKNAAKTMREGANDRYNAKVEKLRFNEKAYREQHGQALFEKAAGKLTGNKDFKVDYGNVFKTTAEMDAEARKDTDKQAKENQESGKTELNKELANGMTVPLNASLEQLQIINEQLKLDSSEKAKQAREQLEALMKLKNHRDSKIEAKVQAKTGTWKFADWWYEFKDWAQGTNLAEERKKAREQARIEATKQVDTDLQISEITADAAKQKALQIRQEEMMEYGTYDPTNIQLGNIRKTLEEQKKQSQNNTQVNTQNNTTNVFQQPLQTQNPRQQQSNRTNIGTN